ncbi:MAG: LptF/LptG family permease [Planctomycetes bacterium]|nr:LptF/LptG family permease [Planctomycetota bacterium]
MRLLERYVLSELMRVFGVLVTISTALLVFVGVVGQAKEHDLGYWQIVQILPFVLPLLLPFTIPAMLLLSSCVVYGRMAGDNEIIAARAAGVNVLILLWPSFFLGGVLSLVALLVSDQVIPWANSNIERVITLAMEDIFIDRLRTQSQINLRDAGITITVTGVDDRTLINPVIRYAPRGGKAVTMQASQARLSFDLPRQQVWLKLQGAQSNLPGQQTAYLQDDEIPFPLPKRNRNLRGSMLSTKDIQHELDLAEQDQAAAQKAQAVETVFALSTGDFERLSNPDFQNYQNRVIVAIDTRLRLSSDLHNRFAMSTSCLFFVLLGSPFAIIMAKKQVLTSFLFCFLPILTVYYPITMMTQNLSKIGTLDPSWAVWAANGVMGIAASYFLRRVLRT